MRLENSQFFFTLVRLGIGNSYSTSLPERIDWDEVQALAIKQGLSAIVLDGIDKLPEGNRPPKELSLQWIGEVLQGYEYRYELYCRAIAEMAGFYNTHGFKMMVLKGYACSLDWPKPEHRPCGDIDIWLFGKQKEADAVLSKEKEVKIDKSKHHHTVFTWRDFSVENHYDFINIHHHKSHVALEEILKDKGQDDSHQVVLYGEKVYLPSSNLHALFLLKHLMLHFVTGEISLRQVLDWAFLIEKHGKDVNWQWLLSVLDEFHMREFFNIINVICVEDLGFSSDLFPYVQFNPIIKDMVMNDIMSPQFAEEVPHNLIVRLIWKVRRWKSNKWKHELCYKESLWSAFWSGVWSHLIKPSSI